MRGVTLFASLLLLLHWTSLFAAPQDTGATGKAANQAGSQAETRPSPKPATTDPGYVIGEADVLDISVWKEPDVSRAVPVRPDGKISLPLLNDVQAAGLTPMQLQQQITEKLRKFLTEPQVTVIVTQINSRRVYIMGEVNRPGMVPLLPDMTVLQLITTAGGFTQFANTSKVRIIRNENGKQTTYTFNYKELMEGKRPEQNLILKPGDSIVVP
jgi:polysaccharide export outer membrane protein